VQAFANKERLYSTCAYSLHLWLLHQFADPFDVELLPMISRLLKRQPVSEVCSSYHLDGKKALNQLMVNYVNSKV
jgi:tRNA(Met) cytidine acetyltransferase